MRGGGAHVRGASRGYTGGHRLGEPYTLNPTSPCLQAQFGEAAGLPPALRSDKVSRWRYTKEPAKSYKVVHGGKELKRRCDDDIEGYRQEYLKWAGRWRADRQEEKDKKEAEEVRGEGV